MEKKLYIIPQIQIETMSSQLLLAQSLDVNSEHHVTNGNQVFSRSSDDWDDNEEE